MAMITVLICPHGLDGVSPSGKAVVFGTTIRRFESFHPKRYALSGVYQMSLAVFPRENAKKSDVKKLRREGQVPANLYGLDKANKNVYVPLDQLQALLRQVRPGLLATTVFQLKEGNASFKAVIKEVQYHKTSYAIIHVDFAIVSDNTPVSVNVPIQVAGLAECPGIKLGGFMRQTIRTLKVRCLPKDIPQELVADVAGLGIGGALRLSDLKVPANVSPIGRMSEVAVVIAKKA
jgi:large subunit ribosomal protein L25